MNGKEPLTDESRELCIAAEALVRAQCRGLLLIEDTAAHAAIMRRALDRPPWTLEHVTRGADALARFSADPNRIVLLDLTLPDADGLELLLRFLEIDRHAAVIVVSAIDQVDVSVEAMRRGAWDYVVKSSPRDAVDKLARAVDRAWKRRVADAENEIIRQARLMEMMRAQRLQAVESVVQVLCEEVSNPLSGVVALSQLLLDPARSEADLSRLAERISRSAKKVADAVQRLRTIPTDPYSDVEKQVLQDNSLTAVSDAAEDPPTTVK